MNVPEGFEEQPLSSVRAGWQLWLDCGRGYRLCTVVSIEILPSGNALIMHDRGRLECSPGIRAYVKAMTSGDGQKGE